MATLIIRKKGVKTWWHFPSDEKEYAVSKMYCKITEELFSVVEQGGRQRGKYNYSDITVYDDTQGGGAETFTSAQALMLRLEALEYIGFPLGSGSGGVGFQPAIVNPQNGQSIIYDDGIWQNGYLDTNGDRFLSVGDILTDENEITLTVGFIGVINSVTSANNTDWVETINYTNTGYQRKDKIVFLSGGNFIRIQGEESLANPVEPITPVNTLQVTVIDVFDDSIGTPTEPIDGSIYIKKPNDWVNISNAGNNSGLYDISEVLRAFNITSYYGSGKVTGFALGISGNNPFLAQTIRIKNSSEDEIPLEHNSADLVIPFWFENEEDYTLKPTEILTLVLKNGKFEIVSSSLGGSNVFEQNITVSLSGGKRIGKYGNGETIPCQGWTFEEWARDVSIEYLIPSFSSFSIVQTTPIEVGTVISGNKNFNFAFQYPENVNDNSISIIDVTNDNTVIDSGLSKTSPVTANIGSITKSAVASHQWRATAVNTLSNTLQSGLATVNWQFRYFRGAVSAIPSNGSDLRTAMLSNSIISNANTFSFTTGTTHKDFVIAIPSHKTLVEAKNTGTNENLLFVLSGTITTVPDAGDTPRSYKVYTLSNAVPFSSNYNINVTLS